MTSSSLGREFFFASLRRSSQTRPAWLFGNWRQEKHHDAPGGVDAVAQQGLANRRGGTSNRGPRVPVPQPRTLQQPCLATSAGRPSNSAWVGKPNEVGPQHSCARTTAGRDARDVPETAHVVYGVRGLLSDQRPSAARLLRPWKQAGSELAGLVVTREEGLSFHRRQACQRRAGLFGERQA